MKFLKVEKVDKSPSSGQPLDNKCPTVETDKTTTARQMPGGGSPLELTEPDEIAGEKNPILGFFFSKWIGFSVFFFIGLLFVPVRR